MKRSLAFLLTAALLFLVLCSCHSEEKAVRVGVMSGPTGIGLSHLATDTEKSDRYDFTVYTDPSVGMTDFLAGDLDLLCLPTNTAAALYEKSGKEVVTVAINCLSSLYVLTKNGVTVEKVEDLAGKTVVTAVPSSTTKPTVDALLAAAQISATVEVEANLDALVARVVQGTCDIAVLPEPKVSAALAKAPDYRVALDIGAEWQRLIGSRPVMGCVVAKKDFCEKRPDELREFLGDAAASTAFVTAEGNLGVAADEIVAAGILPTVGIAKSALTRLRSDVVFQTGTGMRATYTSYLEKIGAAVPEREFFYGENL